LRLLRHAGGGIVADLLADLHRAEFRPAHRAEMGELGALGRQGLVVELLRRLGVEREVELVAPAELETGAGQSIIPQARGGMALILCIGTWPGPSIITWQSRAQAIWVSSPKVSSSANCASSLASAPEPGRSPSPSENDTS